MNPINGFIEKILGRVFLGDGFKSFSMKKIYSNVLSLYRPWFYENECFDER